MASQKSQPLLITPSNRALQGGSATEPEPFQIYVMATNHSDQSADVRVSRYSALLASPDIRDRVPIVGIDLKINIKYGDKMWLEVFYDLNLVPVFAIINKGKKWAAKTVNPAQSSTVVDVYPKQHEFITKLDITTKIAEIEAVSAIIVTYKAATAAELLYRSNVGVLSAKEYTDYTDALDTQYQQVQDLISAYKSNLSQFFQSAPTALWKKLFRTYTLIGYTSYEANVDLNGITIYPNPPAPATSSGVPQATKQVSYKIVQCLQSDLYLADMCYQNRYPAKLPIPYHQPVYYFTYDGKVEETVNTG